MATPKPTPTPNPVTGFTAAKPATGAVVSKKVVSPITGFGAKKTTVTTPVVKPAAPKVDAGTKFAASALGAVLDFGKGILKTLGTPFTFVEGGAAATARKAPDMSNWTMAERLAYAQAGTYPERFKSQKPDTTQDFAKWLAGGAQNVSNLWTEKGPVATAKDIYKKSGIDTSGSVIDTPIGKINMIELGTDIALDPLSYVDGIGAVTKVLGGIKTAGTTALKAGKLASQGKVSERLVTDMAGQTAKKIKPGAETFTQYTKKPLIKENLRTGEKFAKLKTAVDTKYTYKTALGDKNIRNILASAIEAGYKAGAARIVTKFAANDIQGALALEAKMAKRAAKVASKLAPETVETITPKVVVEGVAKDLQPYEMHVNGRTTYVMDNEQNIHKFGSQKSAKEFIKSKSDAPKTIKAPVKIDKPITDTKPFEPNLNVIKSSDKTVQESQKALKTVDRLVAKATGIAGDGALLVKRVNEVLREATTVRTASRTLHPDLRTAISMVAKGTNSPLNALKDWTQGKGKDFLDVAKEIAYKTITLDDGRVVKIGDLVVSKKAFEKYSAAEQKQVIAHFKDFLGAGTADEASLIAKLTTIVGKDMAEKIAATGALTGKTNVAARNALLAEIAKSGGERTYASVTDLANGLRNGDIVDTSIISGILKAIDPEAKLTASVSKALSPKDSYEQLRNIFVTGGVQTIQDTANRLKLMTADTLFKAQGLAMADTAAAYAQARLSGVDLISPIIREDTRQEASQRLARYMGSGQMNRTIEVSLRSIARGLSANFEYIQNEILKSENVIEGVSTFGDLAVRNTDKAFQADTKAALIHQINQSGESKMLDQLFGLIRKDLSWEKIGKESIPKVADPEQIFDKFITSTSVMNDALLSVLGARVVYSKAVEKAVGGKHYIYFTMGDYASIMDNLDDVMPGSKDLAIRSLVADLRPQGATKYDTLSTIGIGQAIRTVVEQFEKTGTVVKKDIVKLLKSRAPGQGKRSATYEKQVDQLANDIADRISTPQFIAEVQRVHSTRAAATVEDTINAAESLTTDMYTALVEGWKANHMKGTDSGAARAQLVRDWFNKFAYASGIFHQQSGEQAQAVMQAASQIFVTAGKLEKLTQDAEAAWLIGSPAKRAGVEANTLYADTMEAINTYFKRQNADLVAGAGRERLPFPTEASRGKATAALTEAKINYETLINEGKNLNTKAEIASWNKKFATAQKKLDAARIRAWENSVQTQHWDNGQWVPTETYDHANAVARNAELEQQIVADGLAAKTKAVDTPFTAPGYRKLTAAESKKWIADWRKENNVRVNNRTKAVNEEVSQQIVDDMKTYEALNLNPGELADRLQEAQSHGVMQEAIIYAPVYQSPVSYSSVKSLPTRLVEGETSTAMKPLLGKFAATSGRSDVQPVLSRMESATMLGMSKVGDIMHTIRKTYKGNISEQEFAAAFKMALSHMDAPQNLSTAARELALHLQRVLDTVFGTAETGEIMARGIDPEHLANSFKRFGVSKDAGFLDLTTATPGDINKFLQELPFAEMPSYMKSPAEKKIWDERAAEFAKTGEDPFTALTKVINAVQFAAFEQRMISDFSNKFSYLAQGLTMEQAIKEGYVAIKGLGSSGTDLTVLLPSPTGGGLYPPHIAEQFMSLQREYNRIFNEKIGNAKVQSFVRNAMELQGFLKATQTIFRVGHHITNMVGDSSTAWISGTRDPRDWMRALSLAKRFASDDIKGKWGANKLDQKFKDLYQTTGSYENKVTRNAGKSEAHVTVAHRNSAGKLVATNVSMDDLYPMLRERNLIMGNIYAEDLQGLYDSVLAEASDAIGASATVAQQKLAKIREAMHKLEEPAGSFSSWYSNIPRIATTIRVLESRSWKNIDEALDAAIQEVNRFHPTIQSLSATERKFIRPAFTYYTWLRGAHYAFIDMAIHHSSAVTAFNKAQYNVANQQGYQPQSFANLWAPNANVPSYVSYSTYGPSDGINGEPMVFKRSILTNDVMDQWKFRYDPVYGLDKNIMNNIDVLGQTALGSVSIIAKPGITTLTGIDPQTGRPSKVDTAPELADATLANIGFWNLYKGLGGKTFSEVAGINPELTPEERQVLLTNWLTGQRGQRILTEANIKNAKLEASARRKAAAQNK